MLPDGYDLLCILGPTASGKTRYAVQLARELDGEILSGDSRQVYRGMDIGTGKDLAEYGEIPYHLIDIADAGEKYNIFQYQKDFERAYRDIVARGKTPILCGGSGLYIEAATCGYHLPDVPPNPALRAELEQQPTEDLIARYEKLRKTTTRANASSAPSKSPSGKSRTPWSARNSCPKRRNTSASPSRATSAMPASTAASAPASTKA